MTSPIEILSAQSVELRLNESRRIRAFVYFLISGGEIVYIGETTNIEARIEHHLSRTSEHNRRRGFKEFDRAFYLEVPSAEALAYEGALIRALRPRYNGRAGRHRGRDNEILISLGLTPHVDERANARDYARSRYRPRGPISESTKRTIAAGRERKKELRALGLDHIKSYRTQRRWEQSRYLWQAVKRQLKREARAS